MRRLIFAICLVASVCAYHVRKHDFKVVVDELEITRNPTKYKLDADKIKTLQNLFEAGEFQPKVHPNPRGTEANLNDYADQIFANLRAMMVETGLDPLEMPDIHEEFSYTLIITYHGELDLTNGWLSDVSTIHRGGDVIVTYDTDVKFLEVTLPIAFNDLQFTYDYSAKIMGLGPAGYIDGKVTDLAVEVKIGFDPVALVLSLDEFNIVHAGNIHVEFHGDALIDWLLDLLADLATTLLKSVILDLLEGIVRGGLDDAIQSINDLIDGFLNPTTPAPETTPVAYFLK
ncbi:uncharacterized protein LOC135137005 [Zophobas morio]|uniref:uncharacterized protein LOC135137005 n=1 Tax=Zophobas morio TaxID=2755281 RepID=UPI0030838B84